jgi:ribosomal-protein-alanine N-acetyltransferase
MAWPTAEAIATERLTLRPWQISDLRALVDVCQDPELSRFTRIPYPYREQEGRAFIAESAQGWRDGRSATFAVCEQNVLRGGVGLIVHAAHLAEVGYWLAKDARGRGVASEAVARLARWGFEVLPLARIQIEVDPRNTPSLRVAERAGFLREGLLRSYAEVHGQPRDVVMFSMLRGEHR